MSQVVLVTDPALVAEALRHRSLDKVLPEPYSLHAIDIVCTTAPKYAVLLANTFSDESIFVQYDWFEFKNGSTE